MSDFLILVGQGLATAALCYWNTRAEIARNHHYLLTGVKPPGTRRDFIVFAVLLALITALALLLLVATP